MKINNHNVTHALIIAQPWIELILSGVKTWEMRSKATSIRGHIALIEKGTGLIVGTTTLDHCGGKFTNAEQLDKFKQFHHVDYISHPELIKWAYPWVLKQTVRLDVPIPYKHPRGAVTWVKLD